MKLAVLAVGVALAGCTDDDAGGTWEPMLGMPTTSIFDLQFDPTGHVVASTHTQLWRYSESHQKWGQVGIYGRTAQFIVGGFAIDPDGTIFAAETDPLETTSMYRLPEGGGQWERADEGLPLYTKFKSVVADRNGTIYGVNDDGIYRRMHGAASWQMFSTEPVGQCASTVDSDNTLYLTCASGVFVIRPGASALEPMPGVRRVHSVNKDHSINVTMDEGKGNGRLAAGATTPEPYPKFPLQLGVEEVWIPWDDALRAPLPVPFGVDADDNAYAIGKDRHADLVDVFKLERGGKEWKPLGSNAYALVRNFLVSPEGDLYHYSFQVDVTKPEAVYRRRAQ